MRASSTAPASSTQQTSNNIENTEAWRRQQDAPTGCLPHPSKRTKRIRARTDCEWPKWHHSGVAAATLLPLHGVTVQTHNGLHRTRHYRERVANKHGKSQNRVTACCWWQPPSNPTFSATFCAHTQQEALGTISTTFCVTSCKMLQGGLIARTQVLCSQVQDTKIAKSMQTAEVPFEVASFVNNSRHMYAVYCAPRYPCTQ